MNIITLTAPAICAGCGKQVPASAQARSYLGGKIYHMPDEEKRLTARTTAPAPQAPQDINYLEQALLAYIEQMQLALANLRERIRTRR